MAKKTRIYKVTFTSQGEVYEIYTASVSQGELFGFIEIEELMFGEKSSVVVDPSEDKLRSEFAGVSRSYIPLHAVIRIDEVERRGSGRIRPLAEGSAKISHFPLPMGSPGKKDS